MCVIPYLNSIGAPGACQLRHATDERMICPKFLQRFKKNY